MSTEYFVICDRCEARASAAVRFAGGSKASDQFADFVVDHSGHEIRIITEHHCDADSSRFKDWKADDS